MRGREKAWPAAGPSPRRSRLHPHSHFPARAREVTSVVATRVSTTDHTFLAEEGEEGLVLLRGEQQGPHVGDPPRRRLLLLLAGAHGVAGGAGSPGPCPPASGRALVPPLGDRGGRRGVRGAASRSTPPAPGGGGRPREGGADGGPRGVREAPNSRPAGLWPDGRCPRTPATALNSQLLLQPSSRGSGSGGGGSRTIQHGSGGGRDHKTQDAGERAGNSAAGRAGPGRNRPSARAAGLAAPAPGPAPSGRGAGCAVRRETVVAIAGPASSVARSLRPSGCCLERRGRSAPAPSCRSLCHRRTPLRRVCADPGPLPGMALISGRGNRMLPPHGQKVWNGETGH